MRDQGWFKPRQVSGRLPARTILSSPTATDATGLGVAHYTDSFGTLGTLPVRFDLDGTAEIKTQIAALEARVAELQQAPRPTLLATLGSPSFRLRRPLPVELHVEEDGVSVHSPDFELYAIGEEEYSALDALRRIICETYNDFSTMRADLGPIPAGILARMEEMIEEVKPA